MVTPVSYLTYESSVRVKLWLFLKSNDVLEAKVFAGRSLNPALSVRYGLEPLLSKACIWPEPSFYSEFLYPNFPVLVDSSLERDFDFCSKFSVLCLAFSPKPASVFKSTPFNTFILFMENLG